MATGVPNLPQPINGMIRTYDNSNRTFTRPYSAKTIFFYKDGDDMFQGVRVPVSKAKFRTMDALKDELSDRIPLSFGVRRVCTPMGRTEVDSLEKLQHLGKYVCSSTRWGKGLDVTSLERLQRWKEMSEAKQKQAIRAHYEDKEKSWMSSSSTREAALLSRRRIVSPTTSSGRLHSVPKQVLFMLNGTPQKFHRIVIRPRHIPLFNEILRELSESLQVPIYRLYTPTGKRVDSIEEILSGPSKYIACKRNERPNVPGMDQTRFPPIATHRRHASRERPAASLKVEPLPPSVARQDTFTKEKEKKENKERKKSPRKKRDTSSTKAKKKAKKVSATDAAPTTQEQAAAKIQGGVRGFLARQKLKKEEIAATKIQANMRGYITRKKLKNGTLKKDVPNDIEGEEKAAVTIQAAFKGYKTRKRFKAGELKRDTSNGEANATESGEKNNTSNSEVASKTVYAITVYVGNRWAADTDADLCVTLRGSNGESGAIYLRQTPEQPKFQQNQMDTFEIETQYLGGLTHLVIGHGQQGYGAGVFIERVLVTDSQTDMAQYVFPCCKWLDTGQVDGKIERTLPAIGFYDLSAMPDAQEDEGGDAGPVESFDNEKKRSLGRWRLSVKTGDKPNSGTTAAVSVTAYGSYSQADKILLNNGDLANAGSLCEFDVDFGDIGDVGKLRFEHDNTGDSPEWFLEWVQMIDQDTGEKMMLYCSKWLSAVRAKGAKLEPSPQLFRELPVVRLGLEPLPLHTYQVSVIPSRRQKLSNLSGTIQVQLTGEFGDSGLVTVKVPTSNGSNITAEQEIKFNVEAVFLGRLSYVSFTIPVEPAGEALGEGLRILQELYDKHGLSVFAGADWAIDSVEVRESAHAPYHFIFNQGRVVESRESGRLRKQMFLSEMAGLTTKRTLRKLADKRSAGNWLAIVVTGDHPDAGTQCTPYLVLYGSDGESDPIPLLDETQKFSSGSTCEFKFDSGPLGRLYKVRVRLDGSAEQPVWYLKKLKLRDLDTGDELRFPVEMWLEQTEENPEVAVEFPAIWPDIPPLPIVVYEIRLHTNAASDPSPQLDAFIQIFGEKGDTGKRFLRMNSDRTMAQFEPGSVEVFELEAVSVQQVQRILVGLDSCADNAGWMLDSVEVVDPDTGALYKFSCNQWLSETKQDAQTEVELIADIA